MTKLAATIRRGQIQYGDKYDTPDFDSADPSIQAAYDTDRRVIVETEYSDGVVWRRAGIVSSTMGWRPSFLLMHRSSNSGSWDTLGANDRVVAYKDGRDYRDIRTHLVVKANLGYSEGS